MRTCRTCKRTDLPDEQFYVSAPGECKDCRNRRTAATRRADPETTRRYARDAYRQARADRLGTEPRCCQQCGDHMAPERAANAKFCCRQCALDAQEKRRRADVRTARAGRLCERCGEEISIERNAHATTCSIKCRDALAERRLMHRACRKLSYYAVKTGRLVKQPCEMCGSPDVEMHHVDYFDPLTVRWLCFQHHRAEHKEQSDEEVPSWL